MGMHAKKPGKILADLVSVLPNDQLMIGREASPSGNGSCHVFRMLVRVGYHETDGQRRVHHANYLNYFERSRVEMLRAAGFDYRGFEKEGLMLVISELKIRYRGAAEFDDLLRISTWVTEVRGARIVHRHEVDRAGELLVECDLVCGCIDAQGRVRRLPKEWVKCFAPDLTENPHSQVPPNGQGDT